jgi:hypothetical protein
MLEVLPKAGRTVTDDRRTRVSLVELVTSRLALLQSRRLPFPLAVEGSRAGGVHRSTALPLTLTRIMHPTPDLAA